MQSKRSKRLFILSSQGLAMGAANKVPGVSGGLVAFVAGLSRVYLLFATL